MTGRAGMGQQKTRVVSHYNISCMFERRAKEMIQRNNIAILPASKFGNLPSDSPGCRTHSCEIIKLENYKLFKGTDSEDVPSHMFYPPYVHEVGVHAPGCPRSDRHWDAMFLVFDREGSCYTLPVQSITPA